MTMRLLLLACAATSATRAGRFPEDEPLDAATVAALPGLAARLPRVDAALAGRERRAGETAAALGLAAEPVAALDDLDHGRWRGRALAEIVAAEPDALASWRADPAAAPHGGESVAALLARVGAWLDGRPPNRRLIAVTHPAVLRAAVVHVLAAPAAAFWRIDAAPLAMVDLRHDGRRWALRSATLDAFWAMGEGAEGVGSR
ncbi:Phosphoserine phosphatase 1 [Rhodoplanes serenus]|uniref:Phosphoserine phosphatase 1 n=1 Tax=Rhodoplanes serenus TaxID=200615 RepID=A0A3S4BVZ0_9BRAD|nr:histidine phosphatase family protein [Rhodoplanes serenus]VCU08733.1 Phosphoserine phosphatase 1 [Rhodoplanes serenus]